MEGGGGGETGGAQPTLTVDELIMMVVKHCVIVLTMFSMVRLNLQGRWSRQTDTHTHTQKLTMQSHKEMQDHNLQGK